MVPQAGVRGAQVGQTIDCTIDDRYGTNYGPKLTLVQGAGGGGGGGGMTPERQRAITRQHSQHMALLYAQIRQSQGKLPAEFGVADLAKITDWFDADVKRAEGSP